MIKLRIVYLLLFTLIISACSERKEVSIVEFSPNTPHQNEVVDSVEVKTPQKIDWSNFEDLNQSALIDIQLAGNEEMKIDDLNLFSKNLLPRIYKINKGDFIWKNAKNIEDAYRVLELSFLDGLLPSDYHEADLLRLQDKLQKSSVKEEKEALFAKHDIVLTDAMLLYGFHLLVGKVDPASIDPNWNYKNNTITRKQILGFLNMVKSGKVFDGIDQLRPQKLDYKAMMNAMRYYEGIKDDDWLEINTETKIELGDTNANILHIRNRLSLCCQWNEYVSDSSVYDSSLYQGILDFQKAHGLVDDGIIGKGTIELLNLSPKHRIEKLKVNLERLRWLRKDVQDYVVQVNIAAFKLYVKKKHELIYECNVMTGKPYHKTPIFTEQMKYIDFNPTWTVPYSIATREILPKLKKEGGNYFTRNNMELLNRSGKAIDYNSVDYNSLSTGSFPYIIRQKPGAKNALGEVKFMFPNKYSVYLHDTQSKALFSKTSRAFSHGCIRVQDPLILAETLLDDRKKWDRKKIDKVIQSRKTKTVNLKKRVDVELLYYTAGLFPNGTMFYLPDVYNRDEKILNKLSKPYIYDEKTIKRVYPNKDVNSLDSLLNL